MKNSMLNLKKVFISILCMAMVLMIATQAVQPALAAGSTYIGNLRSNASPSAIKITAYTTFGTSFQILGNGRNDFNPAVWSAAYLAGVRKYVISYTITVREDVSLWLDKQIVPAVTYTRTATIVAGDRSMPGPFWVKITLEGGRTVVPRTVDEAKSLMFDVSKSYQIKGSTLGVGTHKLFARIEAKWSGYLLSGSDKKDKESPRVTVIVNR